ncbi:MAG TPA: PEGA domain-containing protein, partial [Candidatus Obscuribacterales bacterium]
MLGEKGFLLRLVAVPDGPLRIAMLPLLALDSETAVPPELAAQTMALLQQARPDWIWQQAELPSVEESPLPTASNAVTSSPQPTTTASPAASPSPSVSPASPSPAPSSSGSASPSPAASNAAHRLDITQSDINAEGRIPFNQQIIRLADEKGVDLALGVRLQAVANGYWVLTSLYSGADGSILSNHKLNLSRLDAQELAKVLIEELKTFTNLPPVNDLAATGSELHLRSTPPGLHAYLDDVPVGLTPLILRQVAPGAHQLRLFEQDPYLIERIRIVSEPPGVMVKVNGRELGRTPQDFPAELMLPGRFEIELSSESRDRFEAQIQVQTKPDNVPVQLNQLPVKRTPVTFQELAENHYSLYLPPNHAIDLLLPLDLPAGQIQARQIDAYKYAKLIVDASVSNAQLMLDNEIVGETPFSANLAQGQHSLHLTKNRFRTQEKTVILAAGQTETLYFDMRPRSADTSIFLTPTGELTPQLNIGAKYLTFGNLIRKDIPELAHLYGAEVDYGWPDLFRVADAFDIGLEVSGFLFALQTPSLLRTFPGAGAKLQFLRESDTIPISAALGAYLSLDLSRPKVVGYISLSRNFGDFALHLGIQTHGFSLNAGYTGW